MAHQPISRPDPKDPRVDVEGSQRVPSSDEAMELTEESGLQLAELAAALASHGGGAASNDLALDLVLNEIVEQARLATTASGAAIALIRDEELVCRATTGANAPDLGIRLNTRTGLSGACIQSREVQHCDDTETDSRVDAASCRSLGLRSILVVPVLSGQNLLGVFEIFSPRPNAFGERDVQTVEALSWRIVSNLERAAERVAPPIAAATEPTRASDAPSPMLAILSGGTRPETVPAETISPATKKQDYWTGTLTAVVVSLALLLGWMVGRAGWKTRTSAATPQVTVTAKQNTNVEPAPALNGQASVLPSEKGAGASTNSSPGPSTSSPNQTAPQPSPAPSRPKPAAQDALVVYENGKVIFHRDSAKPRNPISGGVTKAGDIAPLPVSPETANANLLHRVEPDYPEEARQQHIQGSVVLEAVVGSDGLVREVKSVSGNEMLTAAAADAVRQWRFKPYDKGGRAVEFQTQVIVNFKLP